MKEEIEILIKKYLEDKGYFIRQVTLDPIMESKEGGDILETWGSYRIRAMKNNKAGQ